MARSWQSLKKLGSFLCAIALTQFSTNTSAKAADTVVVRFGLFTETITLAELQKTAKTGELPRSLQPYAKRLSEQQRQLFVGALNTNLPLNIVTINRLVNTQIGTSILNDLSTALAREDKAGVQALRAGLVLGSTTPQGLSILSFIAAYPSKRLEINVPQAFKVAGSLNTAFWRTQQFMLAIAPQLDLLNPQPRIPQVTYLFDPSQPGTAKVEILKLDLNDQKRNRNIPVDVYWSTAVTPEKPVIVFSHGFGSVRTDLRYLAEHLASHGYVVVALEHPGSNGNNVNSALQGKNRLVKPEEFLNRPQDISFVLDELEKLNQTANNPLVGKLATQNAMIVGYSFGGGTALTIAGGELQLQRLKQRCKGNLAILSLGEAMQCIAEELPENSYQLRDNRIKAAIALNPTTSLIFGETGLTKVQVPTLVLTSSADKTTPALTEQILGFDKIPSPKWLVGVVGGTHLSVKDPSTTQDQIGKISTPISGDEVVGEKAADVRQLVKALTLSFAAQLTPEAKNYAVFLTSDYVNSRSTSAFPFRLITQIPPNAMALVQEFIDK
ncbi:dienelactone hydrolase [Nostoc linckia z18]|uniref:Dienelactone hydrolase n=2 Tax=Nostoc linckia TaxID=92942 RepID=A0A9Q5Z8S2_NOSLI|nr:alpha/beta hydrolase [Nostoc linckia]PHK38734.1 dienelactone hydrolase [Nostoc linckia z15]PHK44718.1 dienelactone hydrolase [Nostoc linckia z16]PHJ65469.1 dienelactone hydrolase [Nostoc linckia z1]PHJ70334.1 dienelactone hydrolase [Nostoc linckia z3]PHJ73566.1 dienelactone hydrolase [Nostoc linckia z4]